MKVASNHKARWYLCECAQPSCREEFYMNVREYEGITLGEGKLVVPAHKPSGAAVIARYRGALLIGRSK